MSEGQITSLPASSLWRQRTIWPELDQRRSPFQCLKMFGEVVCRHEAEHMNLEAFEVIVVERPDGCVLGCAAHSRGPAVGPGMRVAERCHPAWSSSSAAWRPGAISAEIEARCRFIAAILHQGRISPTALPSLGQMAPKM